MHFTEREIFALVPDPVPVLRIAPVNMAEERFRIRVEQQLVRIEAMSELGSIRTVDAITVEQPGPRFRQVAMPLLIRVFGEGYALDFAAAFHVEKAQLDLFRVL